MCLVLTTEGRLDYAWPVELTVLTIVLPLPYTLAMLVSASLSTCLQWLLSSGSLLLRLLRALLLQIFNSPPPSPLSLSPTPQLINMSKSLSLKRKFYISFFFFPAKIYESGVYTCNVFVSTFHWLLNSLQSGAHLPPSVLIQSTTTYFYDLNWWTLKKKSYLMWHQWSLRTS